jgi:hypothetical protein
MENIDGSHKSSASDLHEEDVDDEGCTLSVTQMTPYIAAFFGALGLVLLLLGILNDGGIVLIILSLPVLLLAALLARTAKFIGADIVINSDGVFRKRGDTTYKAVQWTDVSAIELSKAGGGRAGRTYTVYSLLLNPTKGGDGKRGFGVSRKALYNPGRLIRFFNAYSARYNIPIFLDEGFVKRKLDQIPYEDIDWDPLSTALGRRKTIS